MDLMRERRTAGLARLVNEPSLRGANRRDRPTACGWWPCFGTITA